MPKAPLQHWLVKQEPTAYSWQNLVTDKQTAWTGVRNFQARNNLRQMRKGDLVLFYHSVVGKEIVGLAKVGREAYPDPTVKDGGDWVCVDILPVRTLAKPVTLDDIKECKDLADFPLIRQSRLSVMPVTEGQFETILRLASEEKSV